MNLWGHVPSCGCGICSTFPRIFDLLNSHSSIPGLVFWVGERLRGFESDLRDEIQRGPTRFSPLSINRGLGLPLPPSGPIAAGPGGLSGNFGPVLRFPVPGPPPPGPPGIPLRAAPQQAPDQSSHPSTSAKSQPIAPGPKENQEEAKGAELPIKVEPRESSPANTAGPVAEVGEEEHPEGKSRRKEKEKTKKRKKSKSRSKSHKRRKSEGSKPKADVIVEPDKSPKGEVSPRSSGKEKKSREQEEPLPETRSPTKEKEEPRRPRPPSHSPPGDHRRGERHSKGWRGPVPYSNHPRWGGWGTKNKGITKRAKQEYYNSRRR